VEPVYNDTRTLRQHDAKKGAESVLYCKAAPEGLTTCPAWSSSNASRMVLIETNSRLGLMRLKSSTRGRSSAAPALPAVTFSSMFDAVWRDLRQTTSHGLSPLSNRASKTAGNRRLGQITDAIQRHILLVPVINKVNPVLEFITGFMRCLVNQPTCNVLSRQSASNDFQVLLIHTWQSFLCLVVCSIKTSMYV
jgi:hypothetical protein